MKTFLIFLAMVSVAHAAPFLTCDPQTGVTQYRIDGSIITAATPEGAAMWDVATLPPGTHNGTLEAGRPYVLDGVPQSTMLWSTPVPFVLITPTPPTPSENTALVP